MVKRISHIGIGCPVWHVGVNNFLRRFCPGIGDIQTRAFSRLGLLLHSECGGIRIFSARSGGSGRARNAVTRHFPVR